MIEHRDGRYYDHANAHIDLSNSQLPEGNPAQIVASMVYSTARFATWVWAASSHSVEELEANRARGLELYLAENRRQFEAHFDDHLRNFEQMKAGQTNAG
jgi:hypothetical protein